MTITIILFLAVILSIGINILIAFHVGFGKSKFRNWIEENPYDSRVDIYFISILLSPFIFPPLVLWLHHFLKYKQYENRNKKKL